MDKLTAETIALIDGQVADRLAKAGIDTSVGLVAYQLEEAAKLLVPVITPLRNEIPRVKPRNGIAGTAVHYKQITSFNSQGITAYVQEGKRGGTLSYTEADKVAIYQTIGLENNVTFEAEEAAVGFDDADNLAVMGLMNQVMIEEENQIINNNSQVALGTPDAPTATAFATGGSLPDATYQCYVVALTGDGYNHSSVSSAGVPGQVSRTNAGPSTATVYNGGNSAISAATQIVLSAGGSDQSINLSTPAVEGAVAYAWYVGNTVGAGSHIVAITTINSYQVTDLTGTSGNQAANSAKVASDFSQNALAFDGLISQITGTVSNPGGLVITQATGAPSATGSGTPLTAAGTGQGIGIVEIDNWFRSQWENFRLGADEILVNAQELNNINNKILSAGSAPLIRFNYDVANPQTMVQVAGGTIVGTYLNKFTMGGGQLVPIRLHPNVPPGTIIFRTKKIPYQVSNISDPLKMNVRREMYQLSWPITERRRDWGVYCSELLQNYAPFAFGMITNIANG